MHPGEIYAKTEEGLREIKERRRNLPIALRSLLIMVDGNHTVAQVLERARTLRVDTNALAVLEHNGLIAKRFDAPSAMEAQAAPESPSDSDAKRFLGVQERMSDAITEHLGLRGYLIMLRLQRAANMRDLRDLLPDFAQTLVKRVGLDAATPIVTELERLIVHGE